MNMIDDRRHRRNLFFLFFLTIQCCCCSEGKEISLNNGWRSNNRRRLGSIVTTNKNKSTTIQRDITKLLKGGPEDICLQSFRNGDFAKEKTMKKALMSSNNDDDDDIMVSKMTWNEKKTLSHILASFLSLSLFGLLFHDYKYYIRHGMIPINHKPWYWILGIFYFLEALCCSTRRYLSNMLPPQKILDSIQTLVDTPPIVQWRLQCYHHSKKNDEKVVTYQARRDLMYDDWKDWTELERLFQSMQYYSNDRLYFLKITLVNLLTFADQNTLDEYHTQKYKFLSQEGNRDTYTSIDTMLRVNGFKSKLLAIRTIVGGKGTGAMRLQTFALFTLCGLTVPYRIWFARHCDRIQVDLVKEVSIRGSTSSRWTKQINPSYDRKITTTTNSFLPSNETKELPSPSETRLLPGPDDDDDDRNEQRMIAGPDNNNDDGQKQKKENINQFFKNARSARTFFVVDEKEESS